MLKFAKVFLLLFLMVGCSPSKQPLVEFDQPIPIEDPLGKVVNSPVTFEAVAENPITFEKKHEFLYPSSNWIAVQGLKDETIQANINKEIQAAYDRLITYSKLDTLPPYRGLKAKIDEDYIGFPTIITSVTYNKNNLLSIVVNGQYQFNSSDGSDRIFVSAFETLNFDLTSGRQLKIGDLFTNDASIEDILNPLIFELIRMKSPEFIDSDIYPFVGGYGFLEEVSPFKGIQGNQVFSLDINGLSLYFDYRTPNFDTRSMAFMFTIPYSMIESNFAGTLRFKSDESLYLNPIASYSFLYDQSGANRITIKEESTIDGNPFYQYINYPEVTEAWWLDRIHSIDENAKTQIKRLFKDTITYAYHSIQFYDFGPYSSIGIQTSIQGLDRYFYRQEYETYDVDQNRIEFDDLFREGYDIEVLLKRKIEIELSYLEGDLGLNDVMNEYRKNLSFMISYDNISIASYATSPVNNNVYMIQIYLDYDEIGCENLKMFEEYFN